MVDDEEGVVRVLTMVGAVSIVVDGESCHDGGSAQGGYADEGFRCYIRLYRG